MTSTADEPQTVDARATADAAGRRRARGPRPAGAVPDRRRRRARGRRTSASTCRRQRDARHRRRVGLGQERHVDGDPRAAAEDGEDHRRASSSGAGSSSGCNEKRDAARCAASEIAMVFQDALAALNPVFTVGDQIAEAITVHDHAHRQQRRSASGSIELLDLVGIPNPTQRAEQYPHEYSGGMRQRAMIAMSIANEPDVLIADEPTTALDVTIQAQVLEVLERIQERTQLGDHADHPRPRCRRRRRRPRARDVRRAAGRDRRRSTTSSTSRSHPYTRGLLASLPRLDRRAATSACTGSRASRRR